MNWTIRFGLWTVIALGAAAPAQALTINLQYDPSVATNFGGNTANLQAAMTYAAQRFQNLYNDPITLHMTIKALPGTGTLGSSSTSVLGTLNYADARTALLDDATTANDTSANASLPLSDPSGGNNYAFSRAQAKALGLIASDNLNDGTVTFGAGWTYTFDPNHRAVSGAIDFIGVAEHEMSEVMGRIPLLGVNLFGSPNYTPYDLFRFSSPGTRSMTNANNLYFSIDNGVTNLKNFNNATVFGGDPQDWASGSNDAYNAFSSSGVMNDITAVDKIALDVIGYDLVPLPEPGSCTLLGIAAGVLSVFGWRRRRTAHR